MKRLKIHNWLMIVITIIIAVLAVIMGLAGVTTRILLLAWLFVPCPVVFVVISTRHYGRLATVMSRIYVSLSVTMITVLLIAVAWNGSETALHPRVCDGMQDISEYPNLRKHVEPVSFMAEDGVNLKGWIAIGESQESIVLLHGYRCDKRAVLRQANMLFESGMTVLLFDLRHNGESEGDFVSFGYYEKRDVLAAIEVLESILINDGRSNESVINNIGLLGVSNGGATAILFAAENPGKVAAMVVDSSFKSLDSAVAQSFTHFVGLPAFPFAPITVWITELKTGLSRKDVIPEQSVMKLVDTPILIIHGMGDETISSQDSEAIYQNANQPKEIWLVEGAAHGDASEVAEDEYRERVVNFFRDNLGPSDTE